MTIVIFLIILQFIVHFYYNIYIYELNAIKNTYVINRITQAFEAINSLIRLKDKRIASNAFE